MRDIIITAKFWISVKDDAPEADMVQEINSSMYAACTLLEIRLFEIQTAACQ